MYVSCCACAENRNEHTVHDRALHVAFSPPRINIIITYFMHCVCIATMSNVDQRPTVPMKVKHAANYYFSRTDVVDGMPFICHHCGVCALSKMYRVCSVKHHSARTRPVSLIPLQNMHAPNTLDAVSLGRIHHTSPHSSFYSSSEA